MTNDVSYTYESWQRAGWNRSTEPRIKWRNIGPDQSGNHVPMVVPVLVERTDAARRADLVDTVRRTVGAVDAVTGLRAVRTLAALRAHPERVAARERALATVGHDVEGVDYSDGPDAWPTRNHETVAKRSRKGVTVQEVKRRGVAAVTGGTHAPVDAFTNDAVTDDAVLARQLAAEELTAGHVVHAGRTVYGVRRNRVGAVALDVQRVADRHYGHLGLPPMIGTDAWAMEQRIETPDGVDPARCRVAVSRSGITGAVSSDAVDSLAAHGDVYRAQTRHNYHRVSHVTRVKLPMGRGKRRAGDPTDTCRGGILRAVSAPYTAPTLATALVWSCVAPANVNTHRYVGHRLVARPEPRNRRTTVAARTEATVKNRARDIGTVTAPTTVDGWAELLDNINRGERLKVTSEQGTIVVTRSAAKYNARDKREGREHTWQVRTSESLALKLA